MNQEACTVLTECAIAKVQNLKYGTLEYYNNVVYQCQYGNALFIF